MRLTVLLLQDREVVGSILTLSSSGGTGNDIIRGVLPEPDMSSLGHMIPAHMAHLMVRCSERNRTMAKVGCPRCGDVTKSVHSPLAREMERGSGWGT